MAVNAIKKISARAKQIQRAHPKKTWLQCIKQASAEYRAGKKPAAAKRKRGRVSAVKYIEKGEKKSTPAKNTYRVDRTARGRFKKLVKVAGITRRPSKLMGVPKYQDSDAAREIELYIENDGQLYFSQRKPILVNLSKKHKKGIFDVNKAAILFGYLIESGMKKYCRENCGPRDKWFELLSPADRKILALEMAREAEMEFNLGNYIS